MAHDLCKRSIASILNSIGFAASLSRDHWTKNCEILTNNIKGIQYILTYRKKTGLTEIVSPADRHRDRYKELPFECNVLPGKILTAYQAIVDSTTLRALKLYQRRKKEGFYTISVLTGNYILYDRFDHIFVPIARSSYHPNFKAGLYFISNEVYVIAPLGKILISTKENDHNEDLHMILDRFNNDLKYDSNSSSESMKPYHLVNSNLLDGLFEKKVKKDSQECCRDDMNKTILVTTSRHRDRNQMLHPHYDLLKRDFKQFNPSSSIIETQNGKPMIYTAKLDFLPNVHTSQIETEIPHENLRSFIMDYFLTDQSYEDVLKKIKETGNIK